MDEVCLGLIGDNAGKGCLPASRWTPEDHGKNMVGFNSGLDQFAFTQKVFLPHEGLQVIRSDPFRKGLTLGTGLSCVIFEKIHFSS